MRNFQSYNNLFSIKRNLDLEDKEYDVRERHYLYELERKKNSSDTAKNISPWHDLPLRPHASSELDVFQGLIEIQRNTTAKMEVETTRQFNPIVQDMKMDKKLGKKVLRHYGLQPMFNYGMIPQTWENSKLVDKETGCFGDNDPIDIVDLTDRNMNIFDLPKLKIIGSLCLIDQDELDWKILAIEESFAKDHNIRDAYQYEQRNPGAIKAVKEWFRIIKTFDGKPENRFGRDEQVLSVDKTIQIIEECHQEYLNLLSGKAENPNGELYLK